MYVCMYVCMYEHMHMYIYNSPTLGKAKSRRVIIRRYYIIGLLHDDMQHINLSHTTRLTSASIVYRRLKLYPYRL